MGSKRKIRRESGIIRSPEERKAIKNKERGINKPLTNEALFNNNIGFVLLNFSDLFHKAFPAITGWWIEKHPPRLCERSVTPM